MSCATKRAVSNTAEPVGWAPSRWNSENTYRKEMDAIEASRKKLKTVVQQILISPPTANMESGFTQAANDGAKGPAVSLHG